MKKVFYFVDGSSCSEDSQSETDDDSNEVQSDDGDSSLDDTVQNESLIEVKSKLNLILN